MSNSSKPLLPVLLTKEHDRKTFDCGVEALNEYLRKYALQNQKKHISRTYVSTVENKIVGYYSLAYGHVTPQETPHNISAGLPRYPIPVLLLARLAVDKTFHGKGLGASLLRDALVKAPAAAEIAALRAVVVHAKDETAKAFYERFGFSSSPANPYHLFMMIDDIKASILR
ncbi:MAG: GNAT family N-acetyltransferase [Blastocatellia bacterium]